MSSDTHTSFDYELPVTDVDVSYAADKHDAYIGIAIEVTTIDALTQLEKTIEDFNAVEIDHEEIARRLELDDDEVLTKEDLEEIGINTSKIMEVEWNVNPETSQPREAQRVYVYAEFAQEFLDRIKNEEFNPDGTLKPPVLSLIHI